MEEFVCISIGELFSRVLPKYVIQLYLVLVHL